VPPGYDFTAILHSMSCDEFDEIAETDWKRKEVLLIT
jgi:hypothetical protein